MWMFTSGTQKLSVDNMLVCSIVLQGMRLKYLLVVEMDYSLMMYSMNKGVWSPLMIGNIATTINVDNQGTSSNRGDKVQFLITTSRDVTSGCVSGG